ncbi:MAG: ATP-binding protein [Elainellaceae cyanobacterium]
MRQLLLGLEACGYQVAAAADEQETLARLDVGPVDLILLEVETSGTDSYRICERLKQSPSTCVIPIVFIGIPDDPSGEITAFTVGGADYIAAPFTVEEMRIRVDHHLALIAARKRTRPLGQAVQQLATAGVEASQQARQHALGDELGVAFQRSTAHDAVAYTGAGDLPTAQNQSSAQNHLTAQAKHRQPFEAAPLQLKVRTTRRQQELELSDLLKQITDDARDGVEVTTILQAALEALGEWLGLRYGKATLCSIDALDSSPRIIYDRVAQQAATGGQPSLKDQLDGQLDFSVEADLQAASPVLLEHHPVQFCYRHPDWGWQLVVASPIFDWHGFLGDLWLFWPSGPDSPIPDRDAAQPGTPPQIEAVADKAALAQHVADHFAIAIRQERFRQTAQNQAEILKSLHQQKDDFLSTVSHELCSPVTNMKMAIQMLSVSLTQVQPQIQGQMQGQIQGQIQPQIQGQIQGQNTNSVGDIPEPVDPTARKIQQYLQILTQECDREIGLINDLLELQRLDSEVQAPNIGLISLKSWLSGIVQSFEERLQARQQTLQFRCLSPLTSFRTDVTAVHRILTELLDNACKYTPQGENVLVTARMIDRALQLQVTNFGVEIPAGHLPYVFDKFYQVQNSNVWQKGGTGLGLALVKQLIGYLGGTVQVSSQQGKTSFRLMIPEMISEVKPTV